ncbi:hypothetical protein K439DRAFT_1347620 [Ramaria rubella]|nr:hypothetical protein K439DRAFT_1347620 [Ramaria rubella]
MKYKMLRNHEGTHKPNHEGHEKQQLLSNTQEQILIDWCKYHSHMGDLLTHVQVAQKVSELVGRLPGKNWVSMFLQKY